MVRFGFSTADLARLTLQNTSSVVRPQGLGTATEPTGAIPLPDHLDVPLPVALAPGTLDRSVTGTPVPLVHVGAVLALRALAALAGSTGHQIVGMKGMSSGGVLP